MSIERLTSDAEGCWVEGWRGRYAMEAVVHVLHAMGFPLTHDEDLILHGWEDLDDGLEAIVELSDKAITWANDNLAPEGYGFGWHGGQFYLMSIDEWETL